MKRSLVAAFLALAVLVLAPTASAVPIYYTFHFNPVNWNDGGVTYSYAAADITFVTADGYLQAMSASANYYGGSVNGTTWPSVEINGYGISPLYHYFLGPMWPPSPSPVPLFGVDGFELMLPANWLNTLGTYTVTGSPWCLNRAIPSGAGGTAYLLNGAGSLTVSDHPPNLPPNPRAVGDYDGDRMSDVAWRHVTRGEVWIWPMDGTTVRSQTYLGSVDVGYQIVGTGDFDGDGRSDILWRHAARGEVWIWPMNGTTVRSQTYLGSVDVGYQIVGTGDFDGDGKADILWRHATNGQVWIWPMNGTTIRSQTYITSVDPGYKIVGTGDFDGDGKADILWRHSTNGQVWIWPMNGTAVRCQTYVDTVPDVGYEVVGTGNYDGDGKADILWHHATRGEVWVWLMNATTRRSQTWIATVPDVAYQVQHPK